MEWGWSPPLQKKSAALWLFLSDGLPHEIADMLSATIALQKLYCHNCATTNASQKSYFNDYAATIALKKLYC